MWFRVLIVLVVLAGTASADAPARPKAYFGVTGGAFVLAGFVGEASVDGAVRLGDTRVWVRGRVFAGESDTGDFSSQKWRGLHGGLEWRTRGDPLRAVLGLDAGASYIYDFNESDPNGEGWVGTLAPHLGVEAVVAEHAVLRLQLKGAASDETYPLLTVGIAVQF